MSFKDLSAEEKTAAVAKLRGALNESGLQSVNVMTYREEVLALNQAKEVTGQQRISLEPASLSTAKQEAVDSYNAKLDALDIPVGIKDGLKLTTQVGKGDKFRAIENCAAIDSPGTAATIQHGEGEVLLIDFWATWCPPCQRPMAHNQEMLEKHGKEWGKNVRIIGVSIDQECQKVVNHVKAKGWQDVEHYHRDKSNCSEVYGVKGVPHVLLVDKQGTIVFKGHPAERPDLASDLTALSKGEVPEGLAVAQAAEGDGAAQAEDTVPEDSKEIDSNAVAGDMDKYHNEVGPKLIEAMKDVKLGQMQRCFCVLVSTSYLLGSGKSVGTYQNYRVVVGKQEDLDTVKKVLEDNMPQEMNFEKIEQYHAI